MAGLLVVGLLSSLVPLGAQSPDAPRALSLEEAVQRALERNPSVLIPEAEEDVAGWNHRAARASLLPSASVGGGLQWRGSGEERVGSLTAGELGLVDQPSWYFSQYNASLTYSLSGASLLAPSEARAGIEVAAARSSQARAQLRLEVTRSYLQLLRTGESVRLAESELERAEANRRLAEAQLEVGAVTTLDLRQSEVAVGRARVALVREEGEARNARINLLIAMGEEPDHRELRLTTTFEPATLSLDEEALIEEALASNPELAGLRAQEEQARISLRSARTQYLPSLSAQMGWSGFTRQASDSRALVAQAEAGAEGMIRQCEFQNDILSRLADPLPTQNCGQFRLTDEARQGILEQNRDFPFGFSHEPPSVSVSLSIPVFQGLQRQRQVEQARVSMRSVQLQEENRMRTLRGEVARAVTDFRTAMEAARIEEENRGVALSQLELAREQYQAGLVDFLQLAEAENVRARAEREYLAAIYTVHETLASLEAVVGVPLISR
jgi:outer membrane protein